MRGSVYERREEIFVYNAVGIAPRYVFAMFFSVTLFGEVPTWSTWVGAAFVFTGTLLVARMRRATPAISAR